MKTKENKDKEQKKQEQVKGKGKGITLIMLIIIMIVIIILGTAIVVNIARATITKNADEAVFRQDVAVVQEMFNMQLTKITLAEKEIPIIYTDKTYTQEVEDRVQINVGSENIGKVYYKTSKEKGCIIFGKEGQAKERQVVEVAALDNISTEKIVYRYTRQNLPTYKNRKLKWYVTDTNKIVLEAGDVVVEGDENGEESINKPGIYKMTVNAGQEADWLGIDVRNLKIPEGARVEYSFETSSDNENYNESVSNIDDAIDSQYLRVKLTLVANENGEAPSLTGVRVRFKTQDDVKIAIIDEPEEIEYTGQTMYKAGDSKLVSQVIDFGDNYQTTNKGNIEVPVLIDNEMVYLSMNNPTEKGASITTYVSKDSINWTNSNNIKGNRYVKVDTIVPNTNCLVGKVHTNSKEANVKVEQQIEWATYKTEYYEADAGSEGEWIKLDVDEEIPSNTRIIYTFSKSNDDQEYTEYFEDITAKGNSRYLKVKVEYQKYGATTNEAVLNDLMIIYNVNGVKKYQSVKKEGTPILSLIEKIDAANDEIYNLIVDGKNYSIHTYVFEGDQVWDSMTFGNANDVGASGKYAQNMVVVKVNGNLTINVGATITAYNTTYGGPKGMMIYCTGDITNNGTISMTARGAYAAGEDVYLWKNADGTYEYVPAVGGAGGKSVTKPSGYHQRGTTGTSGSARKTGGGGAGGCNYGTSGAGGAGTSYSGGTGGGGAGYDSKKGTAGSSVGGAGGKGAASRTDASGGTGNPGGTSGGSGASRNGTGGLLIMYSKSLYNKGSITANGVTGGSGFPQGGASGGGSINIFYKENLEQGTVTANGGAEAGLVGGAGGRGSISIGSVGTGSYVSTYKNY